MVWFKVDDKLHSHKKALRAGPDALGLWVLAGSWCADQLTDGFVPDYVALRFDLDAEAKASRLVRAGLWTVAEHDGDTGWQFHDWNPIQPTREDVEGKREYERDKKRAQRRGPEGRFEASPHVSPGDKVGTTQGLPLGLPEGVNPSRPDPTRPDLSPKGEKEPAAKRGTRIPDDFAVTPAMAAWAKKEIPGVDGAWETQKFIDYWRGVSGAKAIKLDWVGTWRNWMRRGAEDSSGRPTAAAAGGATVVDLNPWMRR